MNGSRFRIALRRGTLGAGLVLMLASASLVGCFKTGDHAGKRYYSVDWVLTQSGSASETYEAILTVRDLPSGKVVAQPRLCARWGKPAEITQSSQGGDDELTARVLIDSTGTTAEYSVKMSHAGAVVLMHSARVSLGGSIERTSVEG